MFFYYTSFIPNHARKVEEGFKGQGIFTTSPRQSNIERMPFFAIYSRFSTGIKWGVLLTALVLLSPGHPVGVFVNIFFTFIFLMGISWFATPFMMNPVTPFVVNPLLWARQWIANIAQAFVFAPLAATLDALFGRLPIGQPIVDLVSRITGTVPSAGPGAAPGAAPTVAGPAAAPSAAPTVAPDAASGSISDEDSDSGRASDSDSDEETSGIKVEEALLGEELFCDMS